MPNIKGPILSLAASGTLSKAITYLKRRGRNIAEKKPEIIDVKSAGQLSWRHMFLKCTALWHALSAAEKEEWESLARLKHMTGYAWFQSQCLRPNPGIYLPLQGGTMQGDIDMAKYRILKLPAPSDAQEAFRLSDYLTYVLPCLLREGARVGNGINLSIPHNTWTTLTFNTQTYDTDTIHSTTVNPSRLTCKTAGKYLIIAHCVFDSNATGTRKILILHSSGPNIDYYLVDAQSTDRTGLLVSTLYPMAVNEYVEIEVYQNSGGALNILQLSRYSPDFMMQRVGS